MTIYLLRMAEITSGSSFKSSSQRVNNYMYSSFLSVHSPAYLSLCVMAAFVNRPRIFVNRRSSRVDNRCAIPSCTCRLPENMMVFRNASTSFTISSLGWNNRGVTWEKQGEAGDEGSKCNSHNKPMCTVQSMCKSHRNNSLHL